MDRKSAAGGKSEAAGVISCPTDSTDFHGFFDLFGLEIKVTQIWLSLRPPIFNSQMTQILQMTQIFDLCGL